MGSLTKQYFCEIHHGRMHLRQPAPLSSDDLYRIERGSCSPVFPVSSDGPWLDYPFLVQLPRVDVHYSVVAYQYLNGQWASGVLRSCLRCCGGIILSNLSSGKSHQFEEAVVNGHWLMGSSWFVHGSFLWSYCQPLFDHCVTKSWIAAFITLLLLFFVMVSCLPATIRKRRTMLHLL